MAKKFTYDEHKKRMLGIINRPKQTTDRRGTLGKLLNVVRSKKAKL